MKRALMGAVITLVALIAAGGYYQTGSGLFHCGNYEGGQLTFWFAVAILQLAIYLAADSEPRRRLYATSQLVLFPVLVAVAVQLIRADRSLLSATFLILPIASLLPLAVVSPWPRIGKLDLGSITRLVPMRSFVLWLVFIAWLMLGLWSGLALFVFYARNMTFAGGPLWLTLGLAGGLCAALVLSLLKGGQRPKAAGPLPIGLLLLVLLGAKNPDMAFDSMFYKATRPLLLADGRTALFGIFDHAMLGSTQQEIINALLRILDASYNPSLISTLAFVSMWLTLPTLLRGVFAGLAPEQGRFWWKLAAAALFCFSENHIATATSYQEPLLTLFLAGSLLPGAVGWSFLGMAVGVKLTAVVVIPLFFVWRLRTGELTDRSRRLTAIAGMLLALVIAGGQVYRNHAYVRRLLPPTEMAASITDPRGKIWPREPGSAEKPRGGIIDNFALSTLNIWGMDRLTPVTYRGSGDAGFHVMPASRWPLLGVVAAIAGLVMGIRRRLGWPAMYAGAFILAYLAFLAGTTQGRYFVVLSFTAVLLVALLRGMGPPEALVSVVPKYRNALQWITAGAAALLVGNDLNVGTRINDGWVCKRSLGAPVVRQSWDEPRNDLERELQKLSKLLTRDTGHPPLIWVEHTVGYTPYLGAGWISAQASTDMTLRYFATRPERARDLANAVDVLVTQDGALLASLRQYNDLSDYAEYARVDGKRIFVSKRRMAGEQFIPVLSHYLGLFDEFAPDVADLMPQWHRYRLPDEAPIDTPAGAAAYTLEAGTGGEGPTGVLVAPSQLTLVVPRRKHDAKLELKAAMPYPNSDGMELQLFASEDAAPIGSVMLQPPDREGALEWTSLDFTLDPSTGLGPRRVFLRAVSSSGDNTGDWVFVREARVSDAAR